MKIAVKDANILIDLIEADLLGLWFRLDIETYTTDLVRFEIKKVSQRKTLDGFIEAGLLKVESCDPESLQAIGAIKNEHGISMADASTFFLARKLGAVLLSGDGALREAATASSIEVRGVLWVFDQLLAGRHLTKSEACMRLRQLLDCGSFLPRNVCGERFRAWEE